MARSRTASPIATPQRRRTRPTRTSGGRRTRRRRLEHLDVVDGRSSRSWVSASGTPRSPSTEDVTITFDAGRAGRDQRPRIRGCRRARPRGRTDRRPARPRDERPDREPHHRGEVAWHLRGPGMALLFIAYERLVNAIHNEDTLATYHAAGPPTRAPAVRGTLARAAGADAARVPAAMGRFDRHRRGHAAPAPRRGLHDPRHDGSVALLPAREAVDGARRECRLRACRSHRPAHDAQPRHRRLARRSSSCTPPSRSTRAPSWSSTASCWSRSSRPAVAGEFAANPALEGSAEDEALDNAAMESGTD